MPAYHQRWYRAALVLLLGSVLTGFGGWLKRARARAWRSVVMGDAHVAQASEVWVVFRASDCRVSASSFDTLNAVAQTRIAVVRGVILDGPRDSALAGQLGASFGIGFPVIPDSRGDWARLARARGLATPFLAIRTAGARLPAIVASPNVALVQLGVRSLQTRSIVADNGIQPVPGIRRRFLRAAFSASFRESGGAAIGADRITADGDIIVVYSPSRHTVTAFDTTGHMRWVFGQGSSAAETLPRLSDLHATGGRIIAVSAAAHSLMVISSTGKVLRSVNLTREVYRGLEIGGGRILGLETHSPANLGFIFDSTGVVRDSLPLPSEQENLPIIVRGSRIARLAPSDSVVVAYQEASHLDIVSPQRRLPGHVDGPEQFPFASVIAFKAQPGVTIVRKRPDAPDGALDIDADARNIYVLFSGATAERERLIDVYDRSTLRYSGTYVLPTRASAFAKTPSGFVVLEWSPTDTASIVGWRVTLDPNNNTSPGPQ